MNYRNMRILVMFDLPVIERSERKIATQFRQSLLKDGYRMRQFSVYYRPIRGLDRLYKYINRIRALAPKKGSVRIIVLTEKQFANMYIFTGTKTAQETFDMGLQMSIF